MAKASLNPIKTEEKKQKYRDYMREYMRKKYHDDVEGSRQRNSAKYFFHNNKEIICQADMDKYKTNLPYICKIKKSLNKLKENTDPQVIKEFLSNYLAEMETI